MGSPVVLSPNPFGAFASAESHLLSTRPVVPCALHVLLGTLYIIISIHYVVLETAAVRFTTANSSYVVDLSMVSG